MKKLSIEQKAKRYDEALRRANEYHFDGVKQCIADTLEYIFPELKESENERIRKELIDFVKSRLAGFPDCKRFTDWLEKQCEQEEPQVYETEDGEIITYSETDGYKVIKPKFKVGDWVTNGHATCQITFIDSRYWYSKTCVLGNVIDIDKTFHLWSIQDAKDGNILYFNDDTIVIFKDLYNSSTFHSYCHIEDGIFDISKDELPDWWEGKGFKPATKEQRNLLYQKMKEAGYEWDAEKKELKKIEQKLAWSEEDEKMKDAIYSCVDLHYDGLAKTSLLIWLKSLRPRNGWKPSEEQMQVLKWCKPLFIDPKSKEILDSLINNLKKLMEE